MKPVKGWTYLHKEGVTLDGTDLDQKIDTTRQKVIANENRKLRIIEHNRRTSKNNKIVTLETFNSENNAPPLDPKGGYIIEEENKVVTKFPDASRYTNLVVTQVSVGQDNKNNTQLA